MTEAPPDTVGEEVERDACVMGLRGPCSKKLPIKIKKCVGYNVYYLTPPSACYKAYCFREYNTNCTISLNVGSRPVVSVSIQQDDG